MARTVKRLTALRVSNLTKIGRYAEGGNLYLIVGKDGSKRWTFMFGLRGRQREAGFAPVSKVTLAEARQKAAEWRALILRGVSTLSRQIKAPATPARPYPPSATARTR